MRYLRVKTDFYGVDRRRKPSQDLSDLLELINEGSNKLAVDLL
jgi:hypothetical protein